MYVIHEEQARCVRMYKDESYSIDQMNPISW